MAKDVHKLRLRDQQKDHDFSLLNIYTYKLSLFVK